MRTAERTIESARARDHTISLCYALSTAACPVALRVGDLPAAERYVSMLLDHSAKLGMAVWQAEGRCLKGALLLKRGKVNPGLQLLRTSLDELRGTGSVLRYAAFLGVLAEGSAGGRATGPGRAAVDEALARSESNEERWCVAELLRVKGELVLLERTRPTRRQRRRIISGKPSAGRGGRAHYRGNYASSPASRGCGATKAEAKRRASCSRGSTIVSLRASRRRISKQQRRCSIICNSARLLASPVSAPTARDEAKRLHRQQRWARFPSRRPTNSLRCYRNALRRNQWANGNGLSVVTPLGLPGGKWLSMIDLNRANPSLPRPRLA